MSITLHRYNRAQRQPIEGGCNAFTIADPQFRRMMRYAYRYAVRRLIRFDVPGDKAHEIARSLMYDAILAARWGHAEWVPRKGP